MMAKDPDDRFQTPAAVAEALAPFTGQDTEPAVAAVKAVGGRRTLTRVCAAAVTTLLAGVIFVVTTQGNFEVRSEVDGVQVTVSKDGDTFRVLDVNSGTTVFWLPSAEFQVNARGNVDVTVSRDNVRVTWMGKQVIRISPASRKLEPSDQRQPVKRPTSVESLKLVRTLDGHEDSVLAIDISADGRLAVSGSQGADKNVRVWNLQTGEMLHAFDFATHANCVEISPSGQHVAVGGGSNSIRIWNLQTHEEYRNLQGHTGFIAGLSFSSNGAHLLATSRDGTTRYWDVEKGKVVHSIPLGVEVRYFCVPAISSDGRFAVVCPVHDPPIVFVLDLQEGNISRQFQLEREGRSSGVVVLHEDDKTVLVPHWGNSVSVCDLTTGTTTRVLSIPGVGNIAFLPDNRHAVCDESGAVSVWDTVTGQRRVAVCDRQKYPVGGLAITPDGKTVLAGHHWTTRSSPINEKTRREDFAIRVWRMPESMTQQSPSVGQPTDIIRLQGKWVAISGHLRAKPMSPEQLARMSITFEGNRVTVTDPNGGGQVPSGTFTISADHDPKHITLSAPDGSETLPGIFQFDGDEEPIMIDEESIMVDEDSIMVEIDARNVVMVDEAVVTNLNQLPKVLRSKRKTGIVITAHEDSLHEVVVRVIDAASEFGIQKIRVRVKRGSDRLKLAWIDEDYARPTDFRPSDKPDHMTVLLERAPLAGPALGATERDLLKAANAFLSVMDEGNFGQLYDMCSTWAKQSTARGKTSKTHQTIRDSFGKALHRTLYHAHQLDQDPHLPNGRHAGVQYKTRFERQEVLWETLLLVTVHGSPTGLLVFGGVA
jgi:uncharacterized protein (TIGR03067 family)